MENMCLFVPIGNGGNVTAIMIGLLKLHSLGIITSLPRVFGVQSEHADPVYRYYAAPKATRTYAPVNVTPSVAQAAMIGNPVSFPRIKALVEQYQAIAGESAFTVIEVTEQAIMDSMIVANRHGHITCTQGGECLAGLQTALATGLVSKHEHAVLDATAHALKFMDFQNMYFTNSFPPAFEVTPKAELTNAPELLMDTATRNSLSEAEFIKQAADKMVARLNLVKNES